jgi:hypothetical protein
MEYATIRLRDDASVADINDASVPDRNLTLSQLGAEGWHFACVLQPSGEYTFPLLLLHRSHFLQPSSYLPITRYIEVDNVSAR